MNKIFLDTQNFIHYFYNDIRPISDLANSVPNQHKSSNKESSKQDQITILKKDIFFNLHDPFLGDINAPYKIAFFFDYRCSYCKSISTKLIQRLQTEKDIKIIFKEFPILGPISILASKAALAANKQQKYYEIHQAFMDLKQPLSQDIIEDIAQKIGLNMEQFDQDMNDPEINTILSINQNSAEKLDITGTPTFIVDNLIIPGVIDPEEMVSLIKNQNIN
ncbi:MAG: DsbA family protein [Alphaproteobacteria bacterium]|nr:DsbA family protein [Alphaproteobacteria bacterium]